MDSNLDFNYDSYFESSALDANRSTTIPRYDSNKLFPDYDSSSESESEEETPGLNRISWDQFLRLPDDEPKRGGNKPTAAAGLVSGPTTPKKAVERYKRKRSQKAANHPGSPKRRKKQEQDDDEAADEEIWCEMYGELKEYLAAHGDCLVPQRYAANPALGIWIARQRSFYKRNKLSTNRKVKLQHLGFVWDATSYRYRNHRWTGCCGPSKSQHGKGKWKEGEDPFGGSNDEAWVLEYQGKSDDEGSEITVPDDESWVPENPDKDEEFESTMPAVGIAPEGLQDESEINMPEEDNQPEGIWDQRYKELKSYLAAHGDCVVPQRYSENPALWFMGEEATLATQ